MTPGIKTTEFWLSLIVQVLGACMITGVFPSEHWSSKMAAALVMGLSAMGYTSGRSRVKVSENEVRGKILDAGTGMTERDGNRAR